MDDAEYRAFLKYVFDTYIRDRVHRAWRYLDGPGGIHMWTYEQERLRDAWRITRFIQSSCENTEEIYSTFRPARLKRAVQDVSNSLNHTKGVADEAGFLEAIDSHYDEIVAGLKVEHFPDAELAILRAFGSEDPKRDIQALIHILKSRLPLPQYREPTPVRSQLSRTEEQLGSALQQMPSEDEVPDSGRKSRRWFKGLGQIAQGTALSLADIGLAVGVLHFPVSPETQTYGALVSATTGVGMILTGVGEFRGE